MLTRPAERSGEDGGLGVELVEPAEAVDAKVAIQPGFQFFRGKRLGFIVGAGARNLKIFQHSAGLAGGVDGVRVVSNGGADVVGLGRGTAPEANLQAGKLAHRGDGLGRREVEFASGRDVTLKSGAVADDGAGIEVGEDFQAMPPQNIGGR